MAISGSGAIGGLGSFLKTFAGIREDQARLAEEKARYEASREEERRRHEAQQKQLQDQQTLQRIMMLRQFGGPVGQADAEAARGVGLGHLIQETPGAPPALLGPDAGQWGAPSLAFKKTPDELAAEKTRAREDETYAQRQAALAGITDPNTRTALTLGVGNPDALLPYDVRRQREREGAQFEHGLRMREINAQMAGRETPEERHLREINRSELIALSDIMQRTDWPDTTSRDAAAAQVRQRAEQMRQQIGGPVRPGAAPAVDQDFQDVKADFQTLMSKAPGATPQTVLRRMRNDAESIPDPAERVAYKRALMKLTQEVTNANQPQR